jgi:hypothetical protein
MNNPYDYIPNALGLVMEMIRFYYSIYWLLIYLSAIILQWLANQQRTRGAEVLQMLRVSVRDLFLTTDILNLSIRLSNGLSIKVDDLNSTVYFKSLLLNYLLLKINRAQLLY